MIDSGTGFDYMHKAGNEWFSGLVELLRRECTARPGVVVQIQTDLLQDVVARYTEEDDTFVVDIQYTGWNSVGSSGALVCELKEEPCPLYEMAQWRVSVQMSFDEVLAAVYSHARPQSDPHVDLSRTVQDRLEQVDVNEPFSASNDGILRVYVKLGQLGSRATTGVVYQADDAKKIRILLRVPFIYTSGKSLSPSRAVVVGHGTDFSKGATRKKRHMGDSD